MKLEQFKWITENGISINVDPNKNSNIIEDNSSKDIEEYFKSKTRGLKWEFEGNEIEILESNEIIEGLPSTNLKRVIVIYPIDHKNYPAPNNAVIHNGDGSVFKQLSSPALVSDLAKQQHERKPNGPFMVYFENVLWKFTRIGEVVACISIAFNRDWHEDRELNTETGEFGECISSGRR